MFLRFARSTQPVTLILLTLMVGIMWFTVPIKNDYCNAPAISICSWISRLADNTSLPARLTGMASLLLMASLIININTKFLFIGQRTYLPGMLFLLLALMLHQTQSFHPIFWAGLLLLFALDRLLGTHRYEGLANQVFDAALLTGLAAVFYPPLFFLLPFFFFALVILRPFNWREWFLVITGMAIPFYLTYAWIYLFDKPESNHFISGYIHLITFPCPGLKPSATESIVLYYIIFIVLISFFYLLRIMGNIKIFTRKSYYLFMILALNLVLIYWLIPQAGKEIFILLAIPVSYLLALYFLSGRQTRLRLIFFDALVISAILIRYIN
jgi:hypothetical protein